MEQREFYRRTDIEALIRLDMNMSDAAEFEWYSNGDCVMIWREPEATPLPVDKEIV